MTFKDGQHELLLCKGNLFFAPYNLGAAIENALYTLRFCLDFCICTGQMT